MLEYFISFQCFEIVVDINGAIICLKIRALMLLFYSVLAGYGHSTPKTLGGKLFCICYATIGIPLNIVMFQSIGERFNVFLAYIIGGIKRCFRFRNDKVTELESIVTGGLLCGVVLVGGAAAFRAFEHWNYTESFYYCFITMSTIGFGDYVALQNETVAALQTQPGYVTFCIIYILFGLTVFAAALNKMVLGLLTMNTADERKDELEAQDDHRKASTLNGDVIVAENSFQITNTPNQNNFEENSRENGELLTELAASSSHEDECAHNPKYEILKSVTKSRKFRSRLRLPKLRYSARHKPCQSVTHLLPLQTGCTPLLDKRRENSRLSFLSLDADQQTSQSISLSDETGIELIQHPSRSSTPPRERKIH